VYHSRKEQQHEQVLRMLRTNMSKKRIKVPEVVTGKWIARLISRSKLRWNGHALHDSHSHSYCALGMIAAEAGFSNATIDKVGTPSNGVADLNDSCRTREQVIAKFCNSGREFKLGPWIKPLKATEGRND
jgi:hypothetical protein